ncbi:hypothetical protein C2845_PM11G11400 [Panicum miliaceum]|uniref:Uncharacterized protein n=1 Tax=Panicum miliaceum TaxID=4540 RepID=A0A3L6RSS3_PANMI|nr:hypothetical protein C2845_PM11G11400 [Panicum miliaceum]
MDRIFFSKKRERERKRRRNKEISTYEGPDLISRLPDGVLGAIVTLLQPDEGARTAILSRRWRCVWRSASLNLDDGLKSLDLARNISLYDDWFRLPTFDTLQDLVLHFPMTPCHAELPASALSFASLRVLDLKRCSFPASCCGSLAVPCLTYLSLRGVSIAEELFHCMISNSPGIEAMVLDTNSGYRRLRLSLPRLSYLAVADNSLPCRKELEELVVEDAASLERLLLHERDNGMSVRIIGATKLKMIGYLATGFPIFVLDNSIFKSMVPVSLVEQFSTVKILALRMPNLPKLKVVIAYLKCFPCLEKLKIKFVRNRWTSLKDVVHCAPSAPVECLDHSLKIIVLQSYSGEKPHADFAKFFVKRARILEVMKFCVNAWSITPIWLEDQCRRLDMRTGPQAVLSFLLCLWATCPFGFGWKVLSLETTPS